MTGGSAGELGPAAGFYPDPTGYYEWRYFDPVDGWSSRGRYLGHEYEDSSRDVSRESPPRASQRADEAALTGSGLPTASWPAEAEGGAADAARASAGATSATPSSAAVGVRGGGLRRINPDHAPTPNEAPDGGPVLRQTAGGWIRWDGGAWIDLGTTQEVPAPPDFPRALAESEAALGSGQARSPSAASRRYRRSRNLRGALRGMVLAAVMLGVLAVGVWVVVRSVGEVSRADEAQAAEAAETVTCEARSYAGAQPSDICVSAGEAAPVGGLLITALPMAPVRLDLPTKRMCSTVTIRSAGIEGPGRGNPAPGGGSGSFTIVTPGGLEIGIRSSGADAFAGGAAGLAGDDASGTVCGPPGMLQKGTWALVYDPAPESGPRAVWLSRVT